MKKVVAILFCFVLSAAIVFVLPNYLQQTKAIDLAHENEVSLVNQKVLGYADEKATYYKLYSGGKLVGVISDKEYFDSLIDKQYESYAENFPNTKLGLTDDVYIADETSNLQFEDIDDEIFNYVIENDLLGVSAKAVEFSTSEGVYDIIYVSDINDFYTARDQFFANFISEDTITKLSNNITINSPTSFGTVEMSLKIQEKMSFSDAIVAPDDIFASVDQIYEYLCYGREEERQYYTTKQGDTVQAVGYYFGDMSAKQIMMLNPDTIFSTEQILVPGTVLNVTYFSSPITVEVVKQRLAQESILPDTPLYVEDEDLLAGSREIDREESNGIQNVLYEEVWVNGVLQSGSEISRKIEVESVQAIIRVGTMIPPGTGTGTWGYPVNNPIMTCHYTCYFAHGGVDFQNMYNHYDVVIAADSGTVVGVGWTDIGGYYVRIDHNNGYVTYYGHMRTYPYVSVGDIVERGDILGPIGMTGIATGPHVHFAMYYNSVLINPCSALACDAIPWA